MSTLRKLGVLALPCTALAIFPASGQAAGHAVRAQADSYVRSDKPRASFGHSRRLSVGRTRRQVRYAFLRFDVNVPAGRVVTRAVLKLYAQSRSARRGIVIRAAAGSWRQGSLSWRHVPATGAVLARAKRYKRHHWVRLDLGRVVSGSGSINVAISSRSRAWQRFASREDRRHAPRLVLKTAVAGSPEASRPAGGGSGPSPALPPTPVITPSGEAMPIGDLAGWKQIFADDFTTPVPLGSFPSAVSSRWSAYPSSAHDSSGNGQYNPQKVLSVRDGMLNMFIHTEGGTHMVAAPIPKLTASSDFGQLYGRYSVRFRADPLPGYKTAWLLWPDSGTWPRDGEIDFPEADLNSTIKGYVHHQGASSASDQDRFTTSALYSSWHTAVIEWSPGKVVLSLDGQTVGQTTTRVPSSSMHWVLQTETALGGAAPSSSTQGNLQIDWVAAWAHA
jgi:hypothetical protein